MKTRFSLPLLVITFSILTPARADDLVTLDNGVVRVGVDREKGASITWLSSHQYAKNIVNIADPGRLIQQSYYAGHSLDRTGEGQSAAWSPWTWNPIQGGGVGSWAHATVLERRGENLYSETTPKLWDMPDEPAAAIMRQWTSLEPDLPAAIRVRCEFESQRDENDRWGPAQLRPQELPACYFTRNFANVKSYLGESRWRDETQPPGPPWGNATPPLNVMACFNEDNLGVAVFSPSATMGWNFGPHGEGLSDQPSVGPCMHVAPIGRLPLAPQSKFSYRYWLVVGDEAALVETLDELVKKYSGERIVMED